jgi:hypothetical protein
MDLYALYHLLKRYNSSNFGLHKNTMKLLKNRISNYCEVRCQDRNSPLKMLWYK